MPGVCPGETRYEYGWSRVDTAGGHPNEAAARAALMLLMQDANDQALAQQTAAVNRLRDEGAAACAPGVPPCDPCIAIPVALLPLREWTAFGSLGPPFNNWSARGGYKWKVNVICDCPPIAVAVNVCPVEAVAEGIDEEVPLEPLRQFRDEGMAQSSAGRHYLTVFDKHVGEIVGLLFEEPDLMETAQAILPKLAKHVPIGKAAEGSPVDPKLVEEIDQAMEQFSAKASAELQKEIGSLRSDLHYFSGVSIMEGLGRRQLPWWLRLLRALTRLFR